MARYKKRKDGRYGTSVTLGVKDNGEYNKKYLTANTIYELDMKKEQVLLDYANLLEDLKHESFKSYSLKWLDAKRMTVEHNTYVSYRGAVIKYCASLNALSISKIKRQDIQDIINANMDHSRTCQIILLTLKQIFEQAIDDEIIIRNPCRAVARPRYRKPKKRALTRDEIKMINSAQLTLRERMYVNMLYYFGLRREEALALTKKDFNLRSNVLSINKALVFISNKGVIKDTKSVSSDRVISIQSTIKPFIREYLKHLDGDYLFTSLIDKQLITESSFKKMWKSIMTKFDDAADELCLDQIDGLSSHTFRHNYATMLHSAGVSVKEAQYLLGHSNSSITMDIYTHLDGANLQADNKLSEYLKSIEK